jgi:hypothetical protein
MNKNCLAHSGKRQDKVLVSLKGKERAGMSTCAIQIRKVNKQGGKNVK